MFFRKNQQSECSTVEPQIFRKNDDGIRRFKAIYNIKKSDKDNQKGKRFDETSEEEIIMCASETFRVNFSGQ